MLSIGSSKIVVAFCADMEKKKIHFPRQIHSTSLEVITDLVNEGAGVGILPARVATRHKSLQLKAAYIY